MYVVFPLGKTLFLFLLLVIDWIVIYRVEMSSYPTGHEQMGPFESVPDWTVLKITFNVSSKWKLLFGKAKLWSSVWGNDYLSTFSILIVGGAARSFARRDKKGYEGDY